MMADVLGVSGVRVEGAPIGLRDAEVPLVQALEHRVDILSVTVYVQVYTPINTALTLERLEVLHVGGGLLGGPAHGGGDHKAVRDACPVAAESAGDGLH